MFRESSVGWEGDWASAAAEASAPSHQEIDRQLRRLAKQRAGLDAEESRWLRRAEEQDSWRALGYVHALEYLEEVFGYAPRTAQEKLRVARELGSLPAMEAELESGNLPYSIVRELTRVATPQTEAAWLEKARGRNYRQVEQMLAGHKKGNEPTDAPDPTLIEHDVRWRLDAPTRALLRETRRYIEDEMGHALDDATFVDVLCRRATEAGARAIVEERGTVAGRPMRAVDGETEASESESESESDASRIGSDASGSGTDISGSGADANGNETKPASRPGVMIHLTTCRSCKATVQHGAGVPFALTKEQLECAECDAIIVDDENGKRATWTIPPTTRRYVLERDGYKCRFPGCRSSRNLDAHHLEHLEHGGDHRWGNVATFCRGHHKLNHDGVITISGDADGVLLFTRNGIEIRGTDIRREYVRIDTVRGDSVRGNSVRGNSVRGENVRGESVRGDDVRGESTCGESTCGESTCGESGCGESGCGDDFRDESGPFERDDDGRPTETPHEGARGDNFSGEAKRRLNGPVAIEMTAAERDTTHLRPPVGRPSRYRYVERNTLAKAALQQAGYKSTIAGRAVERATARVPADAPLEVLLKEALRCCD
jgi:5-methylcytosine-specific restriction endonuclease McrA